MKARVLLTAWVLALAACAPALYPVEELTVSARYRLLLADARVLARLEEGPVEITEFRFPPGSPYRPTGLQELGDRLRAQLEARGYTLRCSTYNALPLLGGPQYTLRFSRGPEGVGLFLRPLAQPDAYRLEVAPADPNPPLSCPPR
ncbi:hypothetical protein [Thermus altitudinis]|uniref:hypothetical protein n=1 Tax=Thermus altitudinis TaxID=2908145 RepID=UPI001FA9EFAB|nr:hypothetical protein [Thermus altitudinis]